MLVIFVVILLVVGLAIIGSLYSLFLPFFQQLGDIKQYNVAYYGAVSSVERGMLSLRYHGPGFEVAESGRTNESGDTGNDSDSVDKVDFGGLEDGDMYWSLTSRASTIPAVGEGNVPYAFLPDGASNDYLTLGYNNLMAYTLDLDQTSDVDDYYSPGFSASRNSSLDSISLYAQLPEKLYNVYGGNTTTVSQLADTSCAIGCDRDNDRIANDLVIDWSLEGTYGANSFRIVPRVDVNYVSGTVNIDDNLIREEHINLTTVTANDAGLSDHWTAERASIINPTETSNNFLTKPHNMIASDAVGVLQSESFSSLYGMSTVHDLQLLLGLARILYLPDGKMYPFLETKIESDEEIADLYYHLNGVGSVGDYHVTIRVKKPTSDRSLLGSFTIVF